MHAFKRNTYQPISICMGVVTIFDYFEKWDQNVVHLNKFVVRRRPNIAQITELLNSG